MKRFVIAVVLTCALSGVALAGEMPVGGIAAPVPGPTQTGIAATVVLTLIGLLRR